MKKLGLFFLIISISLSTKILAQEITTDKFNDDDNVYWFYLRADQKIDKILNRKVYDVRVLSRTPKYGTYAKYSEDTWRCLKGGQQLVIGPFRELNAAKQSITIYDLAKYTPDIRDKEIEKLKESKEIMESGCYCYFLKFYVSKRTHSYVLERIPARTSVEALSVNEFLDQFMEGLTMEMLTIGAFVSREEAEESKRLYRLEEK
jgi:hypothetical protein